MNHKKVLLVSTGFYPQISPRSFRTTELAKEFARQGHLVTVITHRNNSLHDKFETEFGITIKDLGELKFSRNDINQERGSISLLKRVIRRGMLQFLEYPDIELSFLVRKILKNEKGYDILISLAVPHPIHWGVASAWKDTKGIADIWVADCGDPYMGDRADSFRKFFYFKYIEKWFCKKADYISVPTAGSIEAYYPEFHHKIKVIPQGFNFEDTRIINDPISNSVPMFAYAGGFIPGIRDPKPLLKFLNKYNKPFKFIIYTSNSNLVLPFISSGDHRFEIRPYIPREELLYELSKMDFLININNGTTVQTPSKLIDYALTKRPILSFESDITDTSVLEQFLQGDYRNRLVVKDLENYNIRNVTRRFLDLCDEKIT